ncbi:MAG: hypothetical protein ACD_74C00207G0003, partial [uncultured bacterium]
MPMKQLFSHFLILCTLLSPLPVLAG